MWQGEGRGGYFEVSWLLTMARKMLIRWVSAEHLHPTTPMPRSPSTLDLLPPPKVVSPGAVSWLSLVAATTAGLGPTATLRAHVRADIAEDSDGLRLVVHSYEPSQLAGGSLPLSYHKPGTSAQRAVTASQLRRGVTVDLVLPNRTQVGAAKPVIVAWVERGRPNLEFDARLARPVPGSPRACAKSRGSSAELSADLLLQAS